MVYMFSLMIQVLPKCPSETKILAKMSVAKLSWSNCLWPNYPGSESFITHTRYTNH